jgi:hypothetical protein
LPKLIASLRAGQIREIPDAREAVAKKDDGLHKTNVSKQIQDGKAGRADMSGPRDCDAHIVGFIDNHRG